MNSAVHSYLILAYADNDKAAMNVGFYYMANAGGRLAGTVLSGLLYQWDGLDACLWASVACVLAAAVLSMLLPTVSVRELTPVPPDSASDGFYLAPGGFLPKVSPGLGVLCRNTPLVGLVDALRLSISAQVARTSRRETLCLLEAVEWGRARKGIGMAWLRVCWRR